MDRQLGEILSRSGIQCHNESIVFNGATAKFLSFSAINCSDSTVVNENRLQSQLEKHLIVVMNTKLLSIEFV
jgi:hypothetical protein